MRGSSKPRAHTTSPHQWDRSRVGSSVRRLKCLDDRGRDAAAVADVVSGVLGPIPYGREVVFCGGLAAGGGLGSGADLPAGVDIGFERLSKGTRVCLVQVDLIAAAVESESDRRRRGRTVEVVGVVRGCYRLPGHDGDSIGPA